MLRERGKATVIECDIPIGDVDPDTISAIAGYMLERIGDGLLKRFPESSGDNCGFSISVPLAPQNIVTIEHPATIPNPHYYSD